MPGTESPVRRRAFALLALAMALALPAQLACRRQEPELKVTYYYLRL